VLALPGAERREGHLPRILERRAQENGVDFVKGVANAITPMAFYETVMVKGYETLVDPDTRVDVNTGMIAAARLQALPQHAEHGDHRDDEFAAITAPEMPEGGQPDQAHQRHQHDRGQHGLGQRGERSAPSRSRS